MKSAIFGFSILGFFTSAFGESAPTISVPSHQTSFLEKNCFECHDSLSEEGGVNLETISFHIDSLDNAALWHSILDSVNQGEMPPSDREQPSQEDKASFLRDLSRTMVKAREALSDQGGEITMRRLNRREYIKTMEDLLGVSVDPALLPTDEVTKGYDTFGSSLFVSPDQVETYYQIAVDSINQLIAQTGKPKPSQKKRIDFENGVNQAVRRTYRGKAEDYGKVLEWEKKGKPHPREVGLIDTEDVKVRRTQFYFIGLACANYLTHDHIDTGVWLTQFEPRATHVLSADLPKQAGTSTYRVRIRVGVRPDAPEERRYLQVAKTPRADFIPIECFKVEGSVQKPDMLDFEMTFREGQQRMISIRERGPTSQELQASQRRDLFNGNLTPKPSLWVDWMEWEGPLPNTALRAKRIALIPPRNGKEGDRVYAERVLRQFAPTAFRGKKITPEFLEKLLFVFDQERREKGSFLEAIVSPLAVMLSSPSFLYLAEQAPDKGKTRVISPQEFASRLSYFLTSAPPDKELLEAFAAGEISNPTVTEAQVERLIDSSASRKFVEGYAHQWLDLKRLHFFQYSATRFPGFDESVRKAAGEEIYAMISASLRGELPLGKFLNHDQVYVNDLLADYYGIEGVEGNEFRPVPVPKTVPRGGLASTAAVLMMGSDGEHTSPVERGVWILRHLLNDPPPPAPANVPQIEHEQDEPKSGREIISYHTTEAQCFQCHRSIDPLGFAFEHFDATGRWREKEEAVGRKTNPQGKTVNFRKKVEIDTTGQFSDGTSFSDSVELKEILYSRRDQFVKGVAEQLIAYGLGRRTTFSDEKLIADILENCPPEPTLRDLIIQLVLHPSFREKRVGEFASAE